MTNNDNLGTETEQELEPEYEPESQQESEQTTINIKDKRSFLAVPISEVLFAPLKATTIAAVKNIEYFEYVFNNNFLNADKTDLKQIQFKSSLNNIIQIPLLSFFIFPILVAETLKVSMVLYTSINYESRKGETYDDEQFSNKVSNSNNNGVPIIDRDSNEYKFFIANHSNSQESTIPMEIEIEFKNQDEQEVHGFAKIKELVSSYNREVL